MQPPAGRLLAVGLAVLALAAACGDSGDDDAAAGLPVTTGVPCVGLTSTSLPADPTREVALLTGVEVGDRDVTFRFDGGPPGVDADFVTPPVLADGSGEPVEVAGRAFLQIRMEPASGVDLSGETYRETYTGPRRLEGDRAPVVELVRTGDFEANLTWAVGLSERVTWQLEARPGRVVVRFCA